MAKRTLVRADSLVVRVWRLHAMDEARHVVFDDLMLDRARLPGPLRRVPTWLTVSLCAMASVLLNLNEVWAARQLGRAIAGRGEIALIVTILCDGADKYLSEHFWDEE